MPKLSYSVQYNYFVTNTFLKRESWSFLHSRPSHCEKRRYSHLLFYSKKWSCYNICQMYSVYSRVEVRCSEKQFQQYRTTLSLAKACTILKEEIGEMIIFCLILRTICVRVLLLLLIVVVSFCLKNQVTR